MTVSQEGSANQSPGVQAGTPGASTNSPAAGLANVGMQSPPVTDKPPPVSAGELLISLLLCGLIGLMGQGIRSIVGLKNQSRVPSNPDQQSVFDVAYLMFSFMIGFLSGVVAGFVTGLQQFQQFHLDDTKVLLAIAAAGYAGADFIENSLSLVIPGAGRTTPKAPNTQMVDSSAALRFGGGSGSTGTIASVPGGPSPVPSGDGSAALRSALRIAAPRVRTDIWVAPLSAAFQRYGLTNERRVAAAIGQFLVEAGASFQEVVENTNYTHADLIQKTFPHAFPTVADAQPYVGKPEALANRAYANRLGNGDEASGDGYRFRGRGLIQLTGRDEYNAFAETIHKTADEASVYLETPEGAAFSGCWYLFTRHCLPFADAWDLSAITLRVNGQAMLGNSERIAYANAILKALG